MKTNGQDSPTTPKPRRRGKPNVPERLKPERVQLRGDIPQAPRVKEISANAKRTTPERS
jgi:hypothetical protein